MKAMTVSTKPATVKQDWYVVDAAGKTLGRLASELARRLRGKHKPIFTPHMDMGDNVIVINADKVAVTGKRLEQKRYYRHSLYIGGLKEISLRDQLQKHPERVIELADQHPGVAFVPQCGLAPGLIGIVGEPGLGKTVLAGALALPVLGCETHIDADDCALYRRHGFPFRCR